MPYPARIASGAPGSPGRHGAGPTGMIRCSGSGRLPVSGSRKGRFEVNDCPQGSPRDAPTRPATSAGNGSTMAEASPAMAGPDTGTARTRTAAALPASGARYRPVRSSISPGPARMLQRHPPGGCAPSRVAEKAQVAPAPRVAWAGVTRTAARAQAWNSKATNRRLDTGSLRGTPEIMRDTRPRFRALVIGWDAIRSAATAVPGRQ
jgi:hypothetical protein